jgi:CMP-N-acetylneuraminic acid synthetase
MRRLLLMGTAREESTRTKNKMTRPFGNSTLYEIYLRKFEEISCLDHPFSNIIMAINKNDLKLWNLSKQSSIKIQERSDFSAKEASLPADIYEYLQYYDEEYVMWVNACFPFLKPETIIKVARIFIKDEKMKSLHCVKERKNWFWDPETKKPITLEKKSHTMTQESKSIYESVHCFLIHNIKTILKENKLWDFKFNDPYLYVVPETLEFFDIDTEEELDICDTLWNAKNLQVRSEVV